MDVVGPCVVHLFENKS